jgi:DNA mismatch repair ATPase MutS
LAAKLPGSSKLKIEAKLFENLNLDDEKAKALTEARAKATEIYSQREQQTKAQLEAAKAAKEQAVAQFKGHEVFKKIDVPVNTPAEEKKRLEAANAQAEKWNKLYEEVVNDETPLAKAEAAFGLVLAHKYKADLDSTKAALQAAQKELDAIKKRSGVTDKGRVVNVPPTAKAPVEFADAGSALDAFAKEHGLR